MQICYAGLLSSSMKGCIAKVEERGIGLKSRCVIFYLKKECEASGYVA